MRLTAFLGIALLTVGGCFALDYSAAFTAGSANLKSAGPMAFGPEGILFVGDSMGGAIVAFNTGDTEEAASAGKINIDAVHEKIAALLGTSSDQVLINDVVVNPISKKAYISVSRGLGPDATPVIVTADSSGNVSEFAYQDVGHARVSLPNLPAADETDRRGSPVRLESITDLAFVDGSVIVAGISNEEFASKLRTIPFPFTEANAGASVEIFHGSHGQWETNSPVRTFVPYEIQSEANILAAYTCTPLVKFPVSDLQPGTKVVGKTIAELGAGNRPLDMIIYNKGGQDYILMNNSSRGVMKMSTENIGEYGAITEQTEITGLPYETIDELAGVQQLDRLDDSNALILVQEESGAMNLRTIALP